MGARYARGADRRPAQNDSRRGWDTREVRRRAAHSGPARARWRCANGYPGIAEMGPRTAAELLNRYRQIEISLTHSPQTARSRTASQNSQRTGQSGDNTDRGQRHSLPNDQSEHITSLRTKCHADADLKLGRLPHDLAASLAALPSMSLTPFAPFLRALRDSVSHERTSSSGLREARLIAG